MANDNKKITNNKTKNTKTTKKTTGTSKKPAAKKTNTVKKATVSKAATSKTTQKKKTTSNAKKKTNVVTTKKAAKKVANSTNNKTKNSAKKSVPKKSTQKKETKKEEKKVIEQPKVSEIKKEEKKISISTNTIYTIIGLAVLAIVLVLTIFIKPTDSNDDSNNSEPTTVTSSPADENIPEDKRKELNSIDIDQYLDMLKGEETKVIYIGRPTCGHCVKQKPVMENIKYEYDVEINYLNTDELNEDGINKLISSNEYFSEGFGTPLTLIVKDNKILDKAVGETSKKDMVELFKKYSLIK